MNYITKKKANLTGCSSLSVLLKTNWFAGLLDVLMKDNERGLVKRTRCYLVLHSGGSQKIHRGGPNLNNIYNFSICASAYKIKENKS